jgi:hypothetical protein
MVAWLAIAALVGLIFVVGGVVMPCHGSCQQKIRLTTKTVGLPTGASPPLTRQASPEVVLSIAQNLRPAGTQTHRVSTPGRPTATGMATTGPAR